MCARGARALEQLGAALQAPVAAAAAARQGLRSPDSGARWRDPAMGGCVLSAGAWHLQGLRMERT